MDYSERNQTTDPWSRHGLPTTDAGSEDAEEGISANGLDSGPVSDIGGADPAEVRPSVTQGFLVALAKAMHAAADQERERLAVVVEEDGAVHVERARARASVEAEELRRLADEDLERISEWTAAEIERIHTEAARRADERRSALDDYLRRHEAIIDTEIQGVDGALAGYRETLEQFFSELTASTDPAEIARRAGTLPPPPDLDEVRASARAEAVGRLAQEPARDGATDDDEGPATAEAMYDEAAESTPSTGDAEIAGSPEVEAALVGVMDPVAAQQSGPPDILVGDAAMEDGGESAEDASLDAARADVTDIDLEPVPVAAGWSAEPNSAVRLLRTIAPWTAPTDRVERQVVDDADEHQEPDKPI
jgi:hypothetical protein